MNLKKDYEIFLQSDTGSEMPSRESQLKAQVQHDLKWFPAFLFSKILFIHFLVGLLTLIICPQFGVGPFAGQLGFDQILMKYGPIVCAMFCGGVFLGSTALALSFSLRRGEQLYLREHKYGIFSAIAFLSLVVFLIINQAFVTTHSHVSLEFSLVWLVSAFVFGLIVFTIFGAGRNKRVHSI